MLISIIKNRLFYSRYYLYNSRFQRLYYNIDHSEDIPDDVLKMRRKMREIHNIDASSYTDKQADLDMMVSSQNNIHESISVDSRNSNECHKIDVEAIKNKYTSKKHEDNTDDNVMHFNFGTVRLDAANNRREFNYETQSNVKEESRDLPNALCDSPATEDIESNIFGNYTKSASNNKNDNNKQEFVKENTGSDEYQTISNIKSDDEIKSRGGESQLNYFDEHFGEQIKLSNETTSIAKQNTDDTTTFITKQFEFNEFDKEYFTDRVSQIGENDNSKLNFLDRDFSNQNHTYSNNNSTKYSDDAKNNPLNNINDFNSFDQEYFSEQSLINSKTNEKFQGRRDISDNVNLNAKSTESMNTANRIDDNKLNLNNESDLNIFDQEYFSGPINSENKSEFFNSQARTSVINANTNPNSQLNPTQSNYDIPKKASIPGQTIATRENNTTEMYNNHSSIDKDLNENVEVSKTTPDEVGGNRSLTMLSISEKKRIDRDRRNKDNAKEDKSTAYDLAVAQRKKDRQKDRVQHHSIKTSWKGKLDSHGFRILTEQVPCFDYITEDDMFKIIKESVIFENDDIVAINKPYGLASHGGPGIHHNVARYLPRLASSLASKRRKRSSGSLDTTPAQTASREDGKHFASPSPSSSSVPQDESVIASEVAASSSSSSLATPSLHMVHRLDKETTGVQLFAKNEASVNKLSKLFSKRKIIKKYLTITKGIPKPYNGIIDIPIAESTINEKYRMTLRPHYDRHSLADLKGHVTTQSKHSLEAVTNYEVVDSNGRGAALVECQPETGVKHQIRCHLAFAMNTPILGDHKYSNFTKLAPQKLYPEMLQALGIRQSKARHLAMHLHASDVIIPAAPNSNQDDVFIRAKLPQHFVQNLKWLGLKTRAKNLTNK